MHSTGEVMGVGDSFGEAYGKAMEGAGLALPLKGKAFISLIINTPLGKVSHYDEKAIRTAALQFNVPCVTTMTGAEALIEAISAKKNAPSATVRSLQEIHSLKKKAS